MQFDFVFHLFLSYAHDYWITQTKLGALTIRLNGYNLACVVGTVGTQQKSPVVDWHAGKFVLLQCVVFQGFSILYVNGTE